MQKYITIIFKKDNKKSLEVKIKTRLANIDVAKENFEIDIDNLSLL